MFLSHILHLNGIENIVVEKHSKDYVLGRIRAGVLEHSSVQLLRQYGLSERMDIHGKPKNGTAIVWQNKESFFIDTARWTGKQMMAWGQTSITEDLYAARERDGGQVICEAENVALHDITEKPFVSYQLQDKDYRIDCDFIAGCDGFHGPSRHAIPADVSKQYQRDFPFGWMGIMVERPPLENFTYAQHEDGMAIAAQRNPMLSRYYIQTPITDKVEDWSDDRFWDTLLKRFPDDLSSQIQSGPSIEKSMAPLRSFVSEPMRWGKLFLAGDACHIVPPTGAKGLNLAFSDVFYLSRALTTYLQDNDPHYIDNYSEMALRRVWAAENISLRLTRLLHVFPDETPFERKIRHNDYDLLLRSELAQQALAHEYIGLPFED